jgi:delta-aminolevulinic acid dehydratase/porphobilinogen synthase
MDFITGLPPVEEYNALWVIVDQLTKMAHFVACADTMGPSDLVDGFISHVVRAHGLPSSIISDQGSLFTSTFWKWIMEAMGTTPNLSTTFYPEIDGQTE